MIDINETSTMLRAFRDTLLSAHTLSIRVQLITLDGEYRRDLTPMFMDGQVTVDATQDITRVLDMTLLDPAGRISIEPDDPSSTSIFIADMIRVYQIIRNPVSDKVFTVPVFTGPIDSVSRDGFFLDIKAVGKEKLGLSNTWNARTFKKGQRKTDIIRSILRDMIGENKMDIPDKDSKLPSDLKLSTDDIPWKVATRLAGSMNMQLFYDGRGVARLRARQTKAVHVVNESWTASRPQVAYDLSGLVNAVRVTGGKPKKAKHKVQYTAVAAKTHPLSPWRLGRGGVPRYIWMSIEDGGLRTTAECRELAESTLQSNLMAGVTFTCDGIMDPRLEEYDCVSISVGDVRVSAPIKQFVVPLTAGDEGSYGYVRRITPKGGANILRIRRKHKHKSKSKKHHKHGADGKGN